MVEEYRVVINQWILNVNTNHIIVGKCLFEMAVVDTGGAFGHTSFNYKPTGIIVISYHVITLSPIYSEYDMFNGPNTTLFRCFF